VLPFVNMSDDDTNEYFSDGISEELLNLLTKIPELRVIARTSSFSYKGKDTKIADMAHELNVGHILEGSVRKSGDQVRITAQLIRASDSTHVWSETYDRTLDSIFAIQDEIAAAMVGQLKVTLLGQIPKAREVDPEAYALFLQGRYFSNQGSAASHQKANELLQQALVIDPTYAPVWAELGRNYMNQIGLRLISMEEGYPKVQEAINKALSLDPENAVANSRQGWNKMSAEGDLVSAAIYMEKALLLEPDNTIVLANAAALVKALGRLEQAIKLEEFALQRDPLNPSSSSNLAGSYLDNGQLEDAEAMFRKTLLLSPDRLGTRVMLARVLLLKGDSEEALAVMEDEPHIRLRLAGDAIAHYDLGNTAESEAALKILIEDHAQAASALIALVYAFRGDMDIAFEWLQKAVEIHGPRVLLNARYSRELENLRRDPRWEEMLTNAGLSKQQLSTIEFEFKLPE
jgi:TolB-like protein/Tfp pilus assembly protein PilF